MHCIRDQLIEFSLSNKHTLTLSPGILAGVGLHGQHPSHRRLTVAWLERNDMASAWLNHGNMDTFFKLKIDVSLTGVISNNPLPPQKNAVLLRAGYHLYSKEEPGPKDRILVVS